MFDIRLDASAFIEWLRHANTDLQSGARNALGQSVALALRDARATQAFKDHTGDLRRSIVRGEKSTWSHFIKATAKYAAYVEHGTVPHVIEARRGTHLRFVQAGAVRFARRVNHPGTKPRHFMQHAGESGGRALRDMLERASNSAFR